MNLTAYFITPGIRGQDWATYLNHRVAESLSVWSFRSRPSLFESLGPEPAQVSYQDTYAWVRVGHKVTKIGLDSAMLERLTTYFEQHIGRKFLRGNFKYVSGQKGPKPQLRSDMTQSYNIVQYISHIVLDTKLG